MLIKDKVYGDEKINEDILIELINSGTLQRLKGVSQQGLPQNYYHRPVFSRFDHSVGALILLRRLGADIEEQIAGLLHDISHTAFSHVVDWVLGDPTKEDYQDNNHMSIVENSNIPTILEKYGFDYKKIANIESYSLLEKSAPSLCADRFDYTIRELKDLREDELVELCVNNLINLNGQMVFKTKESAELFANAYLKLQKEHWAGNEARARYYILADALKKAIESGIITKEDLMKTDQFIINILENSKNNEILEKIDMLKNGFEIKEDNEGIELKKKFRYIDPEVLTEEGIINLTKISLEYKDALEKEKANKDSFVKISINRSKLI
jgi:uncharacterized protein